MVRQVRHLKTWTVPVEAAEAKAEDLALLAELARDEADEETAAEVVRGTAELDVMIGKLDFQFLLNGPEDKRGAILEIHPGAGGVESQDWAEMLLRMYTRYLERQGMKFTTLDLQPAEEAGIKSVSLEIDHPYAYGYLKSETGVHRLVRISPFDAQSRRHTSFASVGVVPELDRRRSKSRSTRTICGWTPTARRAPAASTSTRPTAPCASLTSPRASWSRVSRSAASTATARWP